MKTKILFVKPCQPAGRFPQGTTFQKGDYIPNENRGLYWVKLATGTVITVGRLLILEWLEKNSNQHVTGNDLSKLSGKYIDI